MSRSNSSLEKYGGWIDGSCSAPLLADSPMLSASTEGNSLNWYFRRLRKRKWKSRENAPSLDID